MDRFNSLIEEAKEVYLLVLCDLIADRISCSVGYEVAVEALENVGNGYNQKTRKRINYIFI